MRVAAEQRRKEAQMTHRMILAVTVVTLLSSASLGQAQAPPQNPVPFKATLTGPVPDSFEIPVNPPVFSGRETGTGQADLLGAFQWVGHVMQHGGPDITTPRLLTDGIGVMKAANGDALFFTYSGKVIVGIDSQSRELAFVITGGQGKFLGTAGSGLFRDTVDFSMGKVTRSVEGTLAVREIK
jgi:hypothetical protein